MAEIKLVAETRSLAARLSRLENIIANFKQKPTSSMLYVESKIICSSCTLAAYPGADFVVNGAFDDKVGLFTFINDFNYPHIIVNLPRIRLDSIEAGTAILELNAILTRDALDVSTLGDSSGCQGIVELQKVSDGSVTMSTYSIVINSGRDAYVAIYPPNGVSFEATNTMFHFCPTIIATTTAFSTRAYLPVVSGTVQAPVDPAVPGAGEIYTNHQGSDEDPVGEFTGQTAVAGGGSTTQTSPNHIEQTQMTNWSFFNFLWNTTDFL